jgi:hypothetical protein
MVDGKDFKLFQVNPKNGELRHVDGVPIVKYIDERLESILKEIKRGEDVMDARLCSMNEFRSAMQDQTKNYMTKEEYRLAHKPVEDAVQEFRKFMNQMEGKASNKSLTIATGMATAGLIVALASFILRVLGH